MERALHLDEHYFPETIRLASGPAYVDSRFSAEQSIVLRYHKLNSLGLTAEELCESSIREGLRIVPLTSYRDVQIELLDAVSYTATGTFKSIDGCVVSALAAREGIEHCAVASGGNTGYARALYAERLGIETYWFLPEENLELVPAQVRASRRIHLFPVREPGQVKKVCDEFIARHPEVRSIPTAWKVTAFESLGGFIAEHCSDHGTFDWIAQTVSAGFAPLAYCRVLKSLYHSGALPSLPRFLGIQQEENCHMLKAWKRNSEQEPIRSTKDLLLPIIFDTEPHTYKTQEQLFRLLADHRGDLTTVSRSEFALFEQEFIEASKLVEQLIESGIPLERRDGTVVQRAGFVALAGVIKAIDSGSIAAGSRVLCVLSG